MKQRAALALSALATLAMGTAAQGAVGTQVDLTIKPVSETKARYKGTIKSEEPDCVADRLIKVKSKTTRLVKTRSDGDGKFDELGKRPESGAPIKLKVVEKGDCEALIDEDEAN